MAKKGCSMKWQFLAIALAASALAITPAHATSHGSASGAAHAEHHTLTEGEVRKVDKEAKKLTIRHGPIENLDMPPMTMVFQVQDAAMLDTVKAGDKIRFQAEKTGGAYSVTRIEPSK